MVKVKVEINEQALRETVQEAFEKHIRDVGVECACPGCGRKLVIMLGENLCPSCGLAINAKAGELEL